MELPVWCAVLMVGAVAVPGCLSTDDLFCECRKQQQQHWMYALHCTRDEDRTSGVSCKTDKVLEVPRGYHYVPGYALVRLNRLHQPWAAARQACEQEGARLAFPQDRAEYDGLKQVFAMEKAVHRIHVALIGISDQASEGVFVGTDGLPAPYLPWNSHQPDNYKNEDCVELRDNGLINDVPCTAALPSFCERRLSVGVPEGYAWVEDAGRFYKVHTEERVHAEAAHVCRSENATLAVTDTYRRVLALLRTLQPRHDGYLIGFTDEAVEGDFVTETGRHLKDMEFQVWAGNQPDNYGQENCLVLLARGQYNDVRCDAKRAFICEIVPK